MKRLPTILIFLTALTMIFAFRNDQGNECDCDKSATETIIKSKDFNKSPQYAEKLTDKGFYSLSASDNKELWYRDIENPVGTKFTPLWNDYAPNNYHASHLDFVKYYQDKKDIVLAFQFGPNLDLWAYHIFVIKKVGCCYLATRSYFRHARFTSKGYAIMDSKQLDSLFIVLSEQKPQANDTIESFNYSGYFMDNRNNKSYNINFEKDQLWIQSEEDTRIQEMELRPEIKNLFNFVDKKIKWEWTYPL